MRALQIVAPGEFRIQDVPVPEPGPGQVLLKVLAVTTCPHWDMHIMGGQPMFAGGQLDYPYTIGQPGHEACGDIAAVGEGVTSIAVGERVCAWRDQGHGRPGCYAEYAVIDEDNVIPVPDALAPEVCAPLELAMCLSAHVLYAEKLDAIAGKRVAVFGLGPAGLLCIQLAKAAGASEVVGFDPQPERRELAASMGADVLLDPTGPKAAALPRRRQKGALACAFDCAGIPAAVHQAMSITDELVVLFAVQRQPYTFPPSCWGGLTLAGTRPHTREAAEFAAARLRAGQLDMAPLVTHKMRLSDYARGVELLKSQEALKVAFLPQEG